MVPTIGGMLKKAKKTVKKTRKKSVKAAKPIKKKIKSRVKVPDTQRKPGGPAPFVPKPGGSRPIEKPSMKAVRKTVKATAAKKSTPLDSEHLRSAASKKGWTTRRKNAVRKKLKGKNSKVNPSQRKLLKKA